MYAIDPNQPVANALGVCGAAHIEANPLIPGRGTFFDESITLRDGEGTAFVSRVLTVLDEAEPRKRERSAKQLETATIRTRAILANAMRAHFYRDTNAVLFLSKSDCKLYAGKPNWLRHGMLRKAITALEAAGLLFRLPGKLYPPWSKKQSYASSYAATDRLLAIAEECGITAASLDCRVPYDRLVQLYGPKDRDENSLDHARKGNPIDFKHSPETLDWADTLRAINTFYRQQEIAGPASAAEQAEWVAALNEDLEREGAAYRHPEMFRTDIYRVFNNGDPINPAFDQGGRLFGGKWMNMSSELRKEIRINGRETVELDYGECHPRMLYHQRGIDPNGDLYALDEIAAYEAATGARTGTYRPYVKWLMQLLINGKGRPDAVERPEDIVSPPEIPRVRVIGFLEAKHQPIRDAFHTGIGIRLMRLESDIALEIVTAAMEEGWTALPIHDSFMAPVEYRQRLEALMISSYQRRLGYPPRIKAA